MIDATIGGTLNNKTPKVAQELFKETAMNNYQWYSSKAKPSEPTQVYDVDTIVVFAIQVEALSRKIDGLPMIQQLTQVMQCDLCGRGHVNQECQAIRAMARPTEHIDYLGNAPHPQNNPYNNTYNLG